MLLPLSNHHSSFPSKTLTPPKPFLFLFPSPLPKTLPSLTPKVPRDLLLLRASAADAQILPHSAIQRIADKLRSLGYVEDDASDNNETQLTPSLTHSASAGEIFVPLPNQLPKYRVGHTFDSSWSTPENPVPVPGSGNVIRRYHELRSEVLKEKEKEKRRTVERENVPTLAELKLPPEELRRLRSIGIRLKQKLKVGKAGITEGIVNGIHERWRHTELVRIKCDDICKLNMKRTHDLLERKTGGLVIWRSGSNIVMYRGAHYKYPYFLSENNKTNETSNGALHMDGRKIGENDKCSSGMHVVESAGCPLSNRTSQPPLIQGVGSPNRVRFQLPGEAQLAEESDHLLEGLGPRFTDWWGYDPLPVDADLLPAVIPGYRRPFRLLPYGVKPKLTNDEMTTLKRLGRPLPCHFTLSRNRKLQGLAASIVKLWEKCEIAKIAVKRGVQNTNSELMAEELKWLTGGILLSRDREFIVLYRGKDFLPAAVSLAVEQRRNSGLDGLENRRGRSSLVTNVQNHKPGTMNLDLEAEHDDGKPGTVDRAFEAEHKVVSEQKKLRSSESAITRTSTKLSMALMKKARAETLLTELENEEIQQPSEIDKEGITEEERYMLRKVGLRMKPFLLLGRRGVFDGTVENMHLHWKYRELVKIICGERSIEEVHARARTLEAESGGILVAVERVSKGHAIIVYRGKNYKRPASLRPQTLLNKREALKRSIEAQRRESLKLHVLKLTRDVDDLKLELAKDQETINKQLPKDLKLQMVQEGELDKRQSNKYEKFDTDLQSCSTSPACEQENVEVIDRHGANSTSVGTNVVVDTLGRNLLATQGDAPRGFSIKDVEEDGDKFDTIESEPSSESVFEESDVLMDMDGAVVDVESMVRTCPDVYKSEGHFPTISNAEPFNSPKSEQEVSVLGAVEDGSEKIPFRAARLSNRERLLLRKQALGMKKRPVLAVGKSNIVTGVAKTIKTHFQKHPLAIVNIKGRAKGTSVQEVVSELEQATGAVLVSQEPSKVILYRGWGAGDQPGKRKGKNTRDLGNTPTGQEDGVCQVISPELVSAIRLECGLQ